MLPGPILPGRDCDGCDVCCVVLTIDEPALRKPQGFRCRYLRGQDGDWRCGIYAGRPGTCREFQCGWRQLRWMHEGLRPDKSGLLVRMHEMPPVDGVVPPLVLVFTLLNEGALEQAGLAEAVATAVAAGLEVYLEVPGPPGHTAATARIDEAMAPALQARDKAAVLEMLREGYRKGRQGARKSVKVKLGRGVGGA